MKIQSIWKIEWLAADGSGDPLVLLDYGDLMEDEISLPTEQQVSSSAAISAYWGTTLATGGALSALTWTRQQIHASPAAARSHVLRQGALMPYARQGKIRVSIENGDSWELLSASVSSDESKPVPGVPHATMSTFRARAGKRRPVSVIALFAGIPPNWMNAAPEDIDDVPSDL